jgi:Tfp pilus assembly protein PilF
LNSTHYDQATISYTAQDYPQALKGYYQCLKEDWTSFKPGDAGLVYHRIGNCLIKMKNFREAAVSYQKALQDEGYAEKTSIYVNLGTTLNSIGKNTDAITCFNKALSDAEYTTPYRAYMGLGIAYTELDQHVEAGTAFRDAALDEANPNPVKALTNLATSFMALERPNDAVEAYLAILDFRVTGKTLNTTLERLGQAYVAAERYQEALNTFDDMLAREHFSISPAAQEDYEKARRALGIAAAAPAAVLAAGTQDDPLAGLDFSAQPSPESTAHYPTPDFNEEEGYGAGNVPHPGDTGFFTATDADLIETGKRQMRRERKLRHTGLKVFLAIVVVLVLALGTCIFAYTQGVGIPSQETVVTDFFNAYSAGEPVEGYWVKSADENEKTLERLLDGVAKSSNISIVGIDSKMRESRMLVNVTLPEGDTIHYHVDLVRDFISWKISGIEMTFASINQS